MRSVRWRVAAVSAVVAALVMSTAGASGASSGSGTSNVPETWSIAPPVESLPITATWLETVNYYRTGAGLAPVVAEPAWVAGQLKHIEYMRNTPAEFRTGTYANLHTENPASPWYTPEGDAAGRSSNIGYGTTERAAVESWMTAPFHAIGVMRRQLTRAAFALDQGTALLDVIRGLSGSAPGAPATVFFPGNGSSVALSSFRGELPDPREGCASDWQSFRGLPVFALLPLSPPAGTTARLTLPDGRTIAQGADLCVHTGASYNPTDPVYGATGKSILTAENAVMVIPRAPLQQGLHTVTIEQPGRAAVSWSFAVVGPPSAVVDLGGVPAGAGTARLSWAAPANDGGSAITGFRVQGGSGTVVEVAGSARSVVVPLGLSSEVFYVTAMNEAGAGPGVIVRVDAVPAPGRAGPSFVVAAPTPVPGASAALVNMTMVGGASAGYITADRCTDVRNEPQSRSSGNHNGAQAVANLGVVGLDPDGSLCVYSQVPASIVVDIQGAFSASGSLGFLPVEPVRVLDSRGGGGTLPAGSVTRVSLPASAADATAAMVNLTMVDGGGAGYVTADRCSALTPGPQSKSNGNHGVGKAVSNLSIVPLDADGSFCVYNQSAVNLVVDLQGLFSASAPNRFDWVVPQRLIDTRTIGRPGAGSITRVVSGAPAGTSAVLVNLTMTEATGAGYLTADRCSALVPGPQSKSSGNHDAMTAVANLAVVPVDADGSFCVFTQGDAHLVVDLQGSFRPGAPLAFSLSTPTRVLDTRG